ncbi:MAG TPA: hypothetical protein VF660_07510, partial [Actinomycetota bacterium]
MTPITKLRFSLPILLAAVAMAACTAPQRLGGGLTPTPGATEPTASAPLPPVDTSKDPLVNVVSHV